MVKKSSSWVVFLFGLLQISLGSYGYYQTGSLPSLYAGVGFGVALAVSGLLMFQKVKGGAIAALILTAALTVVFSFRYLTTAKSLPALLALLSGAVLLFLLTQSVRWKKAQ